MNQGARWTAVGALALAGCAGMASSARAVTGQQLLRQCEALERGAVASGDTVRLPKSQDAVACWFYMGAVQDVSATVEREGGPSLLGSCVGPDVTRLELVRTFTRYARANPRDLDLRATALLIPALSARYPCPDRAEHDRPSPRNGTRG
jgi:hypothetical protein